ncbi:MAG: hypothetical protein IJR89_03265 [Clostridia bacterium]|nr:hypothetical protein [Clostridia bacterium]
MPQTSPHADHRARVKKRFFAEGIDGFEDHQILELLLFFAIPQKDTNPLAHALIDRFGSLSAVFNAPPEELVRVEGVGEHAAALLSLVPQLARRYFLDSEAAGDPYDNVDKLGRMFVMQYVGATREIVYLTMLDNKLRIIETVKLYEGSVNSAYITPRKIIEPCLRRGASVAVLAHNHPSGAPVPSGDDLYTTKTIQSTLAAVGIPLLEHFLVAANTYTPLLYRTEGLVRQERPDSFFYSELDKSKFYSRIKDADLPRFEG